jgi:diguanylate cyclase (GGDEF)-like protein/PAS domain S-box-containing protein
VSAKHLQEVGLRFIAGRGGRLAVGTPPRPAMDRNLQSVPAPAHVVLASDQVPRGTALTLRLADRERLAALDATSLMDAASEPALDRLALLSARLLKAPIALISLVDDHRQFFTSAFGLAEPWASRRQTPLTHSFCKHVVGAGSPLLVDDAREHPELKHNLAIEELGVIAYAGMPLLADNDQVLGAFCVMDSAPRSWSATDIETLRDLAAAARSELVLRIKVTELNAARAIHETQARLLQTVLESMGDGVVVCDIDGRVLLANEPAQRARPNDVLETYASLASYGVSLPDGRPCPASETPSARALRGERVSGQELRLKLPDREEAWYSVSANPILDVHGRTVGSVSVSRDITAVMHARTAVQHSEALFRAVVQNLPNGAVLLFDRELRCLVAAGERMFAALGISSATLVGRTIRETASPENVARLEHLYGRVLEGELLDFELRRDRFTFDVRAVPVRDENGAISACLAMCYDVSARKRIEETLRQSELATREHAGRIAVLRRIADAANLSETANQALQACIDLICSHVGWPLGHAYIKKGDEFVSSGVWQDRGSSRFRSFREESERLSFASGPGLIGQAIATRAPCWQLSVDSDPSFLRRDAAQATSLASGLAFPVLIGDQVLAVLEFYSNARHEPEPALLELMAYVGMQLGRVIERDQTRQLLEQHAAAVRLLSLRDELTGLYNRRGFLELAQQQLLLAERTCRAAVLVYMDLDGMKKINDERGHEQGDRALVEMAAILKQTFRASDIVARLGGDEFVVLALDVDVEKAAMLRERTRRAIAAWNEQHQDSFDLALSLGAALRESGESIEDLLGRADALMYEEKRARRAVRNESA